MTDLLLQIGATKLGISLVLAGLALVVQRRFDRPAVSHTLWVLVLLALVLPALFTVPVPGLESAGRIGGGVLEPGGLADGEPLFSAVSPALIEQLKAGLVMLWLTGTVAVLAWSMARTLRFHRVLGTASRPASADVQRMAAGIAGTIGLGVVPEIHTTRAHLSPMVWWIGGKVRVLVPDALLDGMDGEELRWVVAHELAHVRRRDHVTRWLEWLACAAFWWNPVAWWARRELRAAEEFCVDALVLSTLRPGARAYGSSLVTVLDFLSTTPTLRVPAFASEADSGGRASLIERRLRKIMSRNSILPTPRRLRVTLTILVVSLAPIGLVYCGGEDAIAPETGASAEYAEQAVASVVPLPLDESKAKYVAEAALDELEAEGRRVREAIDAGQLTEEEARSQYSKIEWAAVRVKEGQEAGSRSEFTAVQIREKQPVLKRRSAGGEVAVRSATDDSALREFESRIRAAVAAGEITAEDGRKKLEEVASRIKRR